MPKAKPELDTVVRVPRELVDRCEALVSSLESDPEIRALGRVTRAAALRLALLRGIELLERKATKQAKA